MMLEASHTDGSLVNCPFMFSSVLLTFKLRDVSFDVVNSKHQILFNALGIEAGGENHNRFAIIIETTACHLSQGLTFVKPVEDLVIYV